MSFRNEQLHFPPLRSSSYILHISELVLLQCSVSFFLLSYVYYLHVYMHAPAVVYVWRTEETFWESAQSLHPLALGLGLGSSAWAAGTLTGWAISLDVFWRHSLLLGPGTHWAPGSTCLCFPWAGTAGVHHCSWPFLWVLAVKHWSSCFHGTHFTDWLASEPPI